MLLTENIQQQDHSSSSSESDQEDNVSMDSNSMVDDTGFQQQNYLFLFDQEIKFS